MLSPVGYFVPREKIIFPLQKDGDGYPPFDYEGIWAVVCPVQPSKPLPLSSGRRFFVRLWTVSRSFAPSSACFFARCFLRASPQSPFSPFRTSSTRPVRGQDSASACTSGVKLPAHIEPGQQPVPRFEPHGLFGRVPVRINPHPCLKWRPAVDVLMRSHRVVPKPGRLGCKPQQWGHTGSVSCYIYIITSNRTRRPAIPPGATAS